jgi:8-oxo-dGTP pyrophosphatase MutT (NUDIX family)
MSEESTPRRAAVLVPLYRGAGGGIEVVLTRRTEHLPTHPGQISFPGGRFDPGRDEGLLDTALREAEEEIGLRRVDAVLLGALPAVATLISGFEIHPFVARIPEDYPFVPHPGEVAEILTLPLGAHADPALSETHPWEVEGHRVEVPAIRYRGHLVWGATLRILGLLARTDVLSRGFAVTE